MSQNVRKCERCGKPAEVKRLRIEYFVFPFFLILLLLTTGRPGHKGIIEDLADRGSIPEWLAYGVFGTLLCVSGLLCLFFLTLVRMETLECRACGYRFQTPKKDWSPTIAGFVLVSLFGFGIIAGLMIYLVSVLNG